MISKFPKIFITSLQIISTSFPFLLPLSSYNRPTQDRPQRQPPFSKSNHLNPPSQPPKSLPNPPLYSPHTATTEESKEPQRPPSPPQMPEFLDPRFTEESKSQPEQEQEQEEELKVEQQESQVEGDHKQEAGGEEQKGSHGWQDEEDHKVGMGEDQREVKEREEVKEDTEEEEEKEGQDGDESSEDDGPNLPFPEYFEGFYESLPNVLEDYDVSNVVSLSDGDEEICPFEELEE